MGGPDGGVQLDAGVPSGGLGDAVTYEGDTAGEMIFTLGDYECRVDTEPRDTVEGPYETVPHIADHLRHRYCRVLTDAEKLLGPLRAMAEDKDPLRQSEGPLERFIRFVGNQKDEYCAGGVDEGGGAAWVFGESDQNESPSYFLDKDFWSSFWETDSDDFCEKVSASYGSSRKDLPRKIGEILGQRELEVEAHRLISGRDPEIQWDLYEGFKEMCLGALEEGGYISCEGPHGRGFDADVGKMCMAALRVITPKEEQAAAASAKGGEIDMPRLSGPDAASSRTYMSEREVVAHLGDLMSGGSFYADAVRDKDSMTPEQRELALVLLRWLGPLSWGDWTSGNDECQEALDAGFGCSAKEASAGALAAFITFLATRMVIGWSQLTVEQGDKGPLFLALLRLLNFRIKPPGPPPSVGEPPVAGPGEGGGERGPAGPEEISRRVLLEEPLFWLVLLGLGLITFEIATAPKWVVIAPAVGAGLLLVSVTEEGDGEVLSLKTPGDW